MIERKVAGVRTRLACAGLLLATAGGCAQAGTGGRRNASCRSDSDCYGDLVCAGGYCQPADYATTGGSGGADGGDTDGGGSGGSTGGPCDPGEATCKDETLRIVCNDTGDGWDKERCPNDTICVNGKCREIICEPDAVRCADEESLEVCNRSGTAWKEGGKCDEDAVCRDGLCQVCKPGKTRCADVYTVETCKKNGSGWKEEACPDEQICMDGECRPRMCEPGARTCAAGDSVMVCNDDGTGWDKKEDCADGTSCLRGECLTPCEVVQIERSSVGCVFYAVDTNPIHASVPGDYAVALSNIDKTETANVVIEQKSAGAWSPVAGGSFTVAPLDLVAKVLPHRYIAGSAVYAGGAYRITSDLPIIAYQFNPKDGSASYLSDASLLLPRSALDVYHFVAHWPQSPADDNKPNGLPAHIQIVASEATRVEVTSSIATQSGGGVPALAPGVMQPFDLEEGDYLQLTVATLMESFTGTFIRSDKPVGVFASNDCANVPPSLSYCCCEHLEEQIFGLQTWGRKYVGSRGPHRSAEPTVWQVLAYEDDTTVNFDFNAAVTGLPASVVLDRGEMAEYQVNGPAGHPGDFLATGDKPFLLVQYLVGAFMVAGNTDFGDPAMVQAVPSEQYLDRYVVLVPDTWINDYLVLTRKSGAVIEIDGVEAATTWTPVGASKYEVARVTVTDGVHVLTGNSPFGIIVMGWDQYDSYAYPGGLALDEISPMK
jgi:hypothetical protein